VPLRQRVLEDAAELLGVLGHPNRLRILALLHDGEHDGQHQHQTTSTTLPSTTTTTIDPDTGVRWFRVPHDEADHTPPATRFPSATGLVLRLPDP